MKEKKQRKSKIFALLMVLYACIWLVAILFIADIVWDKAYAYQKAYDAAKENSQPEVFMDKLIKEIDARKLVQWLSEDGGYDISEYSNFNEYEKYFEQIIGNNAIVYERTDKKNIYNINVDGQIVAKVKISSDNIYDEYNFTGWKLVDADVLSYMKETFGKTIVADKNYKVYINDKELTVNYRIKEDVTVMGQHMSTITGEKYGTDTYEIKGFLVEPEIYAVDKNGKKVQNTSSSGELIEYVDKNSMQIDSARKKRVADTFLMYFEHMNKLKTYEDIKPMLVSGTNAYTLIEAAQKSLEWVVPVKKITIVKEVIDDYVEYGDSHFSCNVYMDVLKDYGYTTKNEYFDAAVLFKRVNGVWYLDTFILNQ